MNPLSRFALWLSRGDNSFNLLLFLAIPPLLALTATGFF